MDDREPTILHVEDDALLARLVKKAFERFGFRGEMLSAGSVNDALGLLHERARNRKPVSLIISDMQLPDGSGLDLIREVKSDPAWCMTPVIVLSHEAGEGVINDAYALGANSYLPKATGSKDIQAPLQSIYTYWLENAKLPRRGHQDRLQEALERAVGFRTRTAEFYLSLARGFAASPEESAFWLDRALNEGNLSNLLAFFRNKVREEDAPPEMIDRLHSMQMKVRSVLAAAEEQASAAPSLVPALAYRLALDIADALDENVFAEALGVLFPVSAPATAALKARAAAQMEDLASYIWSRTTDEELRRKTSALLDLSKRLRSDG
jgi:CheY-like chemotaxis protein